MPGWERPLVTRLSVFIRASHPEHVCTEYPGVVSMPSQGGDGPASMSPGA